VWDKIYRGFPDLKFYIAGRNSDKWKFLRANKFPNVEVVGEVEDSREFIKTKSIMVVPLFAGSGIRVKIIEAMSLGKAVISTSVGAEGIKYKDGENILIANSVGEFVKKISICVENFNLYQSISKNAILLAKEEYYLISLSSRLRNFLLKLIEERYGNLGETRINQ
jgi:glycosyltransferase involved in cell wall biosynthesis